jgi:CRP-like cAMP-binding protein
MTHTLIKALNSVHPLSEKDNDDILGIVKTRQLKKGHHWLEEGKRNNYIAFIDNGYLRKYYLKDGNEITDSFYFENDFCADLPSIIGKTKPASNIIAMEPTLVTTFSYVEFNKLCERSMALEHLSRLLVESAFLKFYSRTVSFILKTPKERYEDLVKTRSSIIQKATQYHIASYLGIGPQHLSRLRAKK